jgi:hypothetical protein
VHTVWADEWNSYGSCNLGYECASVLKSIWLPLNKVSLSTATTNSKYLICEKKKLIEIDAEKLSFICSQIHQMNSSTMVVNDLSLQ